MPQPPAQPMDAASAAAAAPPGAHDWFCPNPSCRIDNWPWRAVCRECYSPRPPARTRAASRGAPASRTAARNAS
eukprot:3618409-Prorocentrum_lima.AAC.1